jgi:hypothetical protein
MTESAHSGPDFKERIRQFTQPLVDSVDSKLREQIDKRVDERVDERIDAALSARLIVMERAIADLDRRLSDVEERIS